MWKLICAALLALTLAACGDAPDSQSQAADSAPEVNIRVSGNQTTSFENSGSLFCGESALGGEPDYFELYAMQSPYQFNLRFPRDTRPGTYPIYGSDDPQSISDSDRNAYFYWRGEDQVRFDKVSSGEFVLESVPAAQGERLLGTISAEVNSDDDDTIQFEADLDLDAGYQSFDDCP